jgi:universal stress protein A
MSHYHHLLLATDLIADDDPSLKKAASLAHAFNAKLSILHVVEPIPAYAEITPMNVEEEMVEHSKAELARIGKILSVASQDQHVRIGATKHEIIDLAKELKVDLIVLGSHGRHGLSLLLGSTANAVVHGAPCDVLTIRKPEE